MTGVEWGGRVRRWYERKSSEKAGIACAHTLKLDTRKTIHNFLQNAHTTGTIHTYTRSRFIFISFSVSSSLLRCKLQMDSFEYFSISFSIVHSF